jgi:hypothetical protein
MVIVICILQASIFYLILRLTLGNITYYFSFGKYFRYHKITVLFRLGSSASVAWIEIVVYCSRMLTFLLYRKQI